jgi:phage terminase small subunit
MASKPKRLTDRQAAFARRYIICLNAAQAAREAGYAEKHSAKTGFDLLQNPLVQQEIERLQRGVRERADIEADEIVRGLAAIFRADIRKVTSWGFDTHKDEQTGAEFTVPFVRAYPSESLDNDTSFAVAKVGMAKDGTFTVQMHDKLAAADKLMRHLGLFEKDNKQQSDALALLIESAQGKSLTVAPQAADEAADE